MSNLSYALRANSNNENDPQANENDPQALSFDDFEEEYLPPAPRRAPRSPKQIQEAHEARDAFSRECSERRDKEIKYLEELKEDFFLTKWTPANNGRYDIDLPYLMANLDRLVKTVPERAKSINWDEKIVLYIWRTVGSYGEGSEQSFFNGTLRQFLDDMISDKSINTVRIPHFAPPGILPPLASKYYQKNYSISNRTESLIKLKQILLLQGAKPKTTKLTVGLKLKLKIPEDAPYVDWAKWGATIQDPRGRGGATRKRSKKSRKNMSRKWLY